MTRSGKFAGRYAHDINSWFALCSVVHDFGAKRLASFRQSVPCADPLIQQVDRPKEASSLRVAGTGDQIFQPTEQALFSRFTCSRQTLEINL